MARTYITNVGDLGITELTFQDEIPEGWSLKDFDHTISATIFIHNIKYRILYNELTYVATEDGTYVVYINFADGVDLYQFNATSDLEEYRMTIYAFEPEWTLSIKYPMFPPKDLAVGEHNSTVSVTVVSTEGIPVVVEGTATLTVTSK